ncbi:MAG: VanZ family protein [Coriobacteriia bacterium]|nr:VanZ family protein [Coriobacteriia bacterium]
MCASELHEKPKKRFRILSWILVVVWAAIIFGLSAIPGSGFPSHPEALNVIAHFCLYAAFAVLLTWALSSSKLSLWKVALIALAIASLYGASDEFHQVFVPGRTPDIMDWMTDTIGAFVGTCVVLFIISAQKVSRSRKRDKE